MLTDDDFGIVDPTLPELVKLAKEAGFIYLHGEDGHAKAIVLPVGGWWEKQLPVAPKEEFDHDHVGVNGL